MAATYRSQSEFTPRILAAVALSVGVTAVGCSDPPAPPAHNRHYITPGGHFVGHLKPEPYAGPPTGVDGSPIEANDPVVWVIDGAEVTQPEYEIDVNIFRLDFDEKQPITDEVMPYALMTENTGQVVVHRGPPPETITNPAINDGERIVPVYQCVNHECPRVKEIDNAALFPASAEVSNPACPFCDKDNVEPFVMSQQRNMREFLRRHPVD